MKQKLWIRITVLVIVIAMLTLSLSYAFIPFFDTRANAASVSELQKKLDSEEKAVKAKRQELNNVQGDITDVTAEANRLTNEITSIQGKITTLEAEIAETDTKIAETQAKLDQAEAECLRFEDKFKESARVMYENRTTTYLEVLFGASSFSDFMNRVEIIRSINQYDKGVLEEMVAIKEEIAAIKTTLEDQKLEKELNQERLNTQKEELDITVAEKKQLLGELTEEEKQLKKELEQEEKEYESVRSELASMLQTSSPSIVTSPYTGGKFQWPVPGHYSITSYFGYRTHPVTHVYKLHTGIDIGAPTGANILAAADGVVMKACWNNAYGNMVVISHGSGLVTLYGHNSRLLVSAGQSVSRGQVIAKAGSTGYSTGPHCHFEVQKNGSYQNPLQYLR